LRAESHAPPVGYHERIESVRRILAGAKRATTKLTPARSQTAAKPRLERRRNREPGQT